MTLLRFIYDIPSGAATKRRITLTIDEDLYEELENLPRRVSVSEITNYSLKVFLEMVRKGRELEDEELDSIVQKIGGMGFVTRARAAFGPAFFTYIQGGGKLQGMWRILHRYRDRV